MSETRVEVDHLGPHGGAGDCVLTKLIPSGRVRVEHADPRIMITGPLIEQIQAGDCGPWISLNDDLLRIEGVNRTVIYRIGEQVPDQFAYYAEFPD